MQHCRLYLILYILGQFINSTAYSQDNLNDCHTAFLFESGEYAVVDTIMICENADGLPTGYMSDLDMIVCDDGLCAKLVLRMYWDLAGSLVRYDTIPGHPLTKFDHKPFLENDYRKLDEILKDKNSILGALEHDELVDKRIKVKSNTVDAVTSATSQSVKNAVVAGAVYSTYALWHLVFSPLIDSMRSYTLNIYSMQIAQQLLSSDNYDSQLFALKQMNDANYDAYFPQVIQAIKRSVPVIRAYIISKVPLPLDENVKNQEFASVFSELDSYSKSVFIDRIAADEDVAVVFLPLLAPYLNSLDSKQLDKCISAFQKYGIAIPEEFKKT